jgi:hypothetical protein
MKLTGYDGLIGYGSRYHRWAIARRMQRHERKRSAAVEAQEGSSARPKPGGTG